MVLIFSRPWRSLRRSKAEKTSLRTATRASGVMRDESSVKPTMSEKSTVTSAKLSAIELSPCLSLAADGHGQDVEEQPLRLVLLLGQLPGPDLHQPLQLPGPELELADPQPVGAEAGERDAGGAEGEERPGLPEVRLQAQPQAGPRLVPDTVVVGGEDPEGVLAGRRPV